MKHVSIFVPIGHTSVVNIGGTHQMFSWVNEFFEQTGRDSLFDIHMVGLEKRTEQSHGLFTVHADKILLEVKNKPYGHTRHPWKF